MATYTYGKTSLAIIDALKSRLADAEVTVEEAKNIYGGSKAEKVGDLNNVQILQIALLEAHALILQMASPQEAKTPNRAERRNKRK